MVRTVSAPAASLAAMRARSNCGMAMAAMIRIMAMTTRSSIREKPPDGRRWGAHRSDCACMVIACSDSIPESFCLKKRGEVIASPLIRIIPKLLEDGRNSFAQRIGFTALGPAGVFGEDPVPAPPAAAVLML